MKKIDARAEVYFNDDFIQITTFSQGMLDYAEPDVPPHYLTPDMDNARLGHTLRLALAASKKVSTEEFQKIFHSGVIQSLNKDRVARVMKQYGYKTKRAMYSNLGNCSISIADNQIKIQPMHHKSLDGYSAMTDGPQPLYIPETATDAELGAALRESFKRCTSSVK